MEKVKQYDYIIAGAGCAGLSLIMHMIHSERFSSRKILLVEKDRKNRNDRTWCFWEKGSGLFEEIIYSRWEQVWFHETDFSRRLEIAPYQYKLIRGIDFYEHCFRYIALQPNIEILYGDITAMKSEENDASIIVGEKEFRGRYIFNSLQLSKPKLSKSDNHLLQHFKGWVIETPDAVFDPTQAILMDFRIGQQHGTSFVYLLPFASNRALVEYTLFTRDLLEPSQYEAGLRQYVEQFTAVKEYKIVEEEFGVIPMSSYQYPLKDNRIIYIGTAGGQTKASSGYTFRFIQKHSEKIVESLIQNDEQFIAPIMQPRRFRFYDNVLLDILYNDRLPGKEIFRDLFKKNKPQSVLRFLDNESSFMDEMRVISSLPVWPFMKAAWRQR